MVTVHAQSAKKAKKRTKIIFFEHSCRSQNLRPNKKNCSRRPCTYICRTRKTWQQTSWNIIVATIYQQKMLFFWLCIIIYGKIIYIYHFFFSFQSQYGPLYVQSQNNLGKKKKASSYGPLKDTLRGIRQKKKVMKWEIWNFYPFLVNDGRWQNKKKH